MNTDFALLQPYWLFLLPLPWLWFYWRYHHPAVWLRILPVLTMRYPLIKDLQTQQTLHDSEKTRSNKHNPADVNLAIAISLMLFALSQPVQIIVDTAQQKQAPAADLILVVDTALSMSLSDYQLDGKPVSRMMMSKLLLKDFIKHYSGRRMALVISANPPALWLPLTHDKPVILNAVKRLSTLLGARVSDLGATLQLLGEAFNEYYSNQQKVVLLISDGGTQTGTMAPKIAAQQLAEQGFTIYVIAMGTLVADAVVLDNSSLIYEPVNLPMLQEVATSGRGQLFHARDSSAFTEALNTIQNRHKLPANTIEHRVISKAWYPLPLFSAMFLLLYIALRNPHYQNHEKSSGDVDAG